MTLALTVKCKTSLRESQALASPELLGPQLRGPGDPGSKNGAATRSSRINKLQCEFSDSSRTYDSNHLVNDRAVNGIGNPLQIPPV